MTASSLAHWSTLEPLGRSCPAIAQAGSTTLCQLQMAAISVGSEVERETSARNSSTIGCSCRAFLCWRPAAAARSAEEAVAEGGVAWTPGAGCRAGPGGFATGAGSHGSAARRATRTDQGP